MATLENKSSNKKKWPVISAFAFIVLGFYFSLMDTRNQIREDYKKKLDVVKTDRIDLKPEGILSIDQMAAYNNRMDKLEIEAKERDKQKEEEIAKLKEQLNATKSQLTNAESQLETYQSESIQNIADLKNTTENNLEGLKKDIDDKVSKVSTNNGKIDYSKVQLPALGKKYTNQDFINSLNIDGMTEHNINSNSNNIVVEDKPKVESRGKFLSMVEINKPDNINQSNVKGSKNTMFDQMKEKVDNGIKKVDEITSNLVGQIIHIDMGLADAMLLTGVDAPTSIGGNTQEPLPALLSIRAETLIANSQYQDFSGCLLLATATGSASTERATLRLSRISCRSADGKRRIEAQIEGEVLGEDSKPGLKGTLVTKNGAIIMKGVMAAFAQGVASAFTSAPSQMTLTGTSANFAQGAGSGGGQALNTLAQFYIDMAKEMYPVIEVKGGRTVSVYFKGQDVTFTEVDTETVFNGTKYSFTNQSSFNGLDIRLER